MPTFPARPRRARWSTIPLLIGLVVYPVAASADDRATVRIPPTALWQWPEGGEATAPDELDPHPVQRRGSRQVLDPDAWADQVRDRYAEVQGEEAPRVGRLTVFSVPRPGAQVHVDGVYKGITPTMLRISAGVHVLRVGFAGFPAVEQELDLRALEEGSLHELVVDIAATQPERPSAPEQ